MKIIKACTICVLFFFCVLHTAQAQLASPPISEPDYNKPKLFNDLPDSLLLNMQELDGLFAKPLNSSIHFSLTQKVQFHGTVVSKSDETLQNFQSIVLKSSNRLGAVFTLTRMLTEANEIEYTGTILSRKHGDAFELIGTEKKYYLIKKSYYDLNNE